MITFKKNIITLALTGALVGGLSTAAKAQQLPAAATAQAQTTISTAELNKFADAFQEVQVENQAVQQEMMGIIKTEGLDVQRFTEIQKAQMNPETEVEATDEELKKHAAVVAELKKMQPALETKMAGIIEEHGLTLNRYKAVAMALQQDKELQKKFQGIMMKKQTEG